MIEILPIYVAVLKLNHWFIEKRRTAFRRSIFDESYFQKELNPRETFSTFDRIKYHLDQFEAHFSAGNGSNAAIYFIRIRLRVFFTHRFVSFFFFFLKPLPNRILWWTCLLRTPHYTFGICAFLFLHHFVYFWKFVLITNVNIRNLNPRGHKSRTKKKSILDFGLCTLHFIWYCTWNGRHESRTIIFARIWRSYTLSPQSILKWVVKWNKMC